MVFGAFNVLLHRRFGRIYFKWGQVAPALGFDFWNCIGEDGAQLLFLGIGIILVAAGSLLLIRPLL